MTQVAFSFFRVTWSLSRRRGAYFAQDRLATTLVDHPGVERALIADGYRSIAGRLRDSRNDVPPPPEPHTLHSPLRLRRTDPQGPDAVGRTYARYGRGLAWAVRRAGLIGPALVTTNPFLAAHAATGWACSVTWYATDDYHAADALLPWRPAFDAAYARLRERRVAVCAVSQPILDRVAPTGEAVVVPNGVDEAEWAAPGPPPGWLAALPRPWLVYAGGLDDRVDANALRNAARAANGGSVVLIGRVLDSGHVARLKAINGVIAHPPVGRAELVAAVASADACLLPHRRTRLTEAMSPLKLYEYLAGGRPVASIDLPPVAAVEGRIALAASSEFFGDAVREALALGPSTEAERRSTVSRHSWRHRHETILALALDAASGD